VKTLAAELVTILHDEGVGHLFLNPLMHTAPIRRALADADASGHPHARPVLCAHEHAALCAAHGHHLAGGGPQAVMVHVEGAPLELGGALENALRDLVPVTLFSGLDDEPPAEAGRSRGSVRSGRLTGKWTADLSRGGDPSSLIRRAFQVARTEPEGLTRVMLPPDALASAVGASARRLTPPRPPAADMAALDEMAQLLSTAESPIVVAGRVGRHPSAVHDLALLAETLAAPVLDLRNRVNLPPGHPLNAAMEGADLLAEADAILLLDVDLACVPGLGPLPTHAWILQVDTDCLKTTHHGWVCPVEIAVTADTGMALAPLQKLLEDRLGARRRQVHERRVRVEAALAAKRETWRARAASAEPEDLADGVLAELQRALPDDAIVLEEANASGGCALRQLERPPGHYFRTASMSPGWSVGAAIGARLARPRQPVVAVCDDTAFTQGLPTAAFWSAHRAGASFLSVVLDRSGRQVRPGTRRTMDESEVVAAAKASGAETAVITQPSQVAAAVERLLATTRDGVCAVLDARLPRV
jgi:acetolactate synthase-1/2/3 large subunit